MDKTILFMDNTPTFLDPQSRLFEQEGYKVIKALDLEQAEQALNEKRVHLAILDIRMLDENDPLDISGLEMARKPEYRSLTKIMLTAFPTHEYARDAMEPDQRGLPSAVGFVGKAEDPDILLRTVERAFSKHVRIDWDLSIQWQEPRPSLFSYLVTLIQPDLDNALLAERTGELEDLFRKLFFGHSQITLGRLFWHREGRVAVEVFAFDREKEDQLLVICGQSRDQDMVPQRKPVENATLKTHQAIGVTKALSAETLRYYATAWRLSQPHIEESTTLADFIHANPESKIRAALEHLFLTVAGAWYHSRHSRVRDKSLTQFHRTHPGVQLDGLPPLELQERIKSLLDASAAANLVSIISRRGELLFRFPNNQVESYPDPLSFLWDDEKLPDIPSEWVETPAGLASDTILVDRDAKTWPTEFLQTQLVPIFHDFVKLETSIRANLVPAHNLITLHHFEYQLLNTHRLGDAIHSGEVEPEYRKALVAIQTIRRLAVKVADDHPLAFEVAGDHVASYYVALLFCTVQDLVTYDPSVKRTKGQLAQLVHRLLLAAMICSKIAAERTSLPQDRARGPAAGLKIDENNHEVQVDGKTVHLTPVEYDLLLYLYRNADQLCRRSDIAREVFDYTTPDRHTEKGLISTPIYRLRKKIERDPSDPRYIVTVRGQGYKFVQYPE